MSGLHKMTLISVDLLKNYTHRVLNIKKPFESAQKAFSNMIKINRNEDFSEKMILLHKNAFKKSILIIHTKYHQFVQS